MNTSDDRASLLRGSRIPPEVGFLVIDHLRDNKETLATITLTNRQWGSYAQRLLFESFEIVVRFKFRVSEATTTTPTTPRSNKLAVIPSPLPDVIALLEASPHLCMFIRRLTIRSKLPIGQRYSLSMDPNSEFILVLKRLGVLHTLILDRITLVTTSPVVLGDVARLNLSLNHISLISTIANQEHVALLSGASPKLVLQLYHSTLSGDPSASNHNTSSSNTGVSGGGGGGGRGAGGESNSEGGDRSVVLSASTLEVEGACPIPGIAFPSLVNLNVNHRWDEDIDQYFRYVSGVLAWNGSVLQRLRLDITRMFPQRLYIESSHLPQLSKHCGSLQQLHLGFPLYLRDTVLAASHAVLNAVTRIVSSSPNTLTTLTFEVFVPAHSSFWHRTNDLSDAEDHWRELSEVLGVLTSLTCVRFVNHTLQAVGQCGRPDPVVCWLPLDHAYRQFFEKRFETLRSRGVLCFS